MGQPERSDLLPVHALVLALRSDQAQGLPGDVRRHRAVGFAGAVLRAGQVRGAAARAQDRRDAVAVAYQHAGRPRRQIRPPATLPRHRRVPGVHTVAVGGDGAERDEGAVIAHGPCPAPTILGTLPKPGAVAAAAVAIAHTWNR